MYAIFSHGGKQYQAEKGQIIRLEKIKFQIGEHLHIKHILMIVNKKNIKIGNPTIENSSIIGHVIKHGRQKKIKIIKFKRRKHYHKQQGHRQYFTDIKIIDIINK